MNCCKFFTGSFGRSNNMYELFHTQLTLIQLCNPKPISLRLPTQGQSLFFILLFLLIDKNCRGISFSNFQRQREVQLNHSLQQMNQNWKSIISTLLFRELVFFSGYAELFWLNIWLFAKIRQNSRLSLNIMLP